MNREQILEHIRKQGGLADDETAIRAARAVVCSLRDRLSPEEVEDFVKSLEQDMPELLTCEAHPHRPPERAKERLTEPEVAEVMDVSRGTVATTLHRARRSVAAALGEQHEVEPT